MDPNVTIATASDDRVETLLTRASAWVAELEPKIATEALLAAQMVGAQRAAMNFLHRALTDGQQVEIVDRNVNRAAKLMRLFNEQVETMAKLKRQSGQQRVIVEHVTVAAGGQAVVGAVVTRGVWGLVPNDRQ
jgi:hypothetical protein